MVILGGMGSIFGPVLGVAVYLGLEQVATAWTEHWMLILGPVPEVVEQPAKAAATSKRIAVRFMHPPINK